jgi:hypothetical protein
MMRFFALGILLLACDGPQPSLSPMSVCLFPSELGEIKAVSCVGGYCTVCFAHECRTVRWNYAGCRLQ